MPFIPRDPRQYRPGNPGQEWLDQLRSGGRLTASLPLLEATGAFTDRMGAPGQRTNWRDRQAAGQRARAASGSYLDEPGAMQRGAVSAPRSPTASQRIPAVRSAIASLRPGGGQAPTLGSGGYAPDIGRAAPGYGYAEPAAPTPPAERGFGIGDYVSQPGFSTALLGAGGAMMEAAGRPGATFGGSLGTGLKGFATERARYGASEAARQQTAQEAATGVTGQVSTVTAMLDQLGITDPTERARFLQMARTEEGFAVAVDQLGSRVTGAQEAASQELSVNGLLDLLEITDAETRAKFNRLPKATAIEILQDQYTAQQGGGAAGGVSRQNWDYYQELLKTDPTKAEEFWESTQGASRMPAAPIQIAAELKRLGGEGWKEGDEYNAAQLQFLAHAENLAPAFGGMPPTPAQQVFDTEQLREARGWDRSGQAVFDSKVAKFDEILTSLNESNTVSGAFVGTIMEAGWVPEWVKALTVTDAINTLDTIRSIVFESLRDTLGPQFTEREGDRLVAASYNSYLPEEMNRVRMRRLRTELTKTADNKNRMMAHYNEHGTFVGYEEPYVLGAGGSVPMAHLMIEPSDYSGVASDDLERVIGEDIRNFTDAEARALFVDLQDELESEAVLEMRRQLLGRVN